MKFKNKKFEDYFLKKILKLIILFTFVWMIISYLGICIK